MKLLRLKITDPKGFRSLQAGFEHHFRTEWDLQEEESSLRPLPFTAPHFGVLRPLVKSAPPFAPFVCAGPNGSGKSNLLEVLAAIFYHLDCMYLENRPDSFDYEEQNNPKGFRSDRAVPDGFEIEYLIRPHEEFKEIVNGDMAHVLISKEPRKAPHWILLNHVKDSDPRQLIGSSIARGMLPEYILGYSSGENEILSLPFFKTRFVQYDEYWQALKEQLPYYGHPESRLVYLDSGFSQAILLCNLLFQDAKALRPFREDVKIEGLKEFRIIIRGRIKIDQDQIASFDSSGKHDPFDTDEIIDSHPALFESEEEGPRRFYCNLLKLLDGGDTTEKIIPRLTRCATCWYQDEASDTLYLDFLVNGATRQAFRDNFSNDQLELFQAFQVLLTLNLFSASEGLKKDLYQSDSLYVSETVPILASDERIMRFKNFLVTKTDADKPVLLKSLSDGEHQLLHTLGLCLLFKNTQSLFLLDEPETHFNPDWRANFISRLQECFKEPAKEADKSPSSEKKYHREMLVTTHTPFLISDSKPEKVLVFEKKDGNVTIRHPGYNTLGASINKITMNTFGKRETIGGHAQRILNKFRDRLEDTTEDKEQLITEINEELGDSVEKILLIKTIFDSMEVQR